MTVVIDDEPQWLKFCQEAGYSQVSIDYSGDELVIISSRLLYLSSKLRRFVVATGSPTTRGSIEAYRLGALDYFRKDFRIDILIKRIKEAEEKRAGG